MAFDPKQLALISSVNGYGHYRYDTTDALTDVDGEGYINNSDDAVNLQKGDIIDVVVWGTALRTGTINDVGRLIVMVVRANNDVNLSTDLTSWANTYGD